MSERSRAWALFALVLSGEAIFFLPFVIPRVFKPTYLDVFGINNFELGTYFSVYGIIAIAAYLVGGPLADRFPAYKLMTVALVSTGLGGIYMASIPNTTGMHFLYGYWGLTTILLFWASLMRATRLLGGEKKQGFAFGMLDGGRGMTAAVIGAVAVWILAIQLTDTIEATDPALRHAAFQRVILFFSMTVFVTAFIVNRLLRPLEIVHGKSIDRITWEHVKTVLHRPAVWLQAVIIICAYSGYRVADDFSLLARDALGYDEVSAAGVGTLSLWLRPVAAIGAGLIADRFRTSNIILLCFALLISSGLLMGFAPLDGISLLVVLTTIASTSIGVYALRGLYFAIMEEGRIPVHVTGTAVGIASIVGYLPDVYMAPLMGHFLDFYPGVEGHRYVFLLLAAFAFLGFVATLVFKRIVNENQGAPQSRA